MNSKTLVFAHRGSKSNNPENTLAAFREAIRVQSDGIELDVHLSLDNELIIIHDEKIDRTTNGKGLVRKMTSANIQNLMLALGIILILLTKKFLASQKY